MVKFTGRSYLLVAIFVLAIGMPAFAQRETGAIVGMVSSNGEAFGGVTVTVSSPSLIGTNATTHTDARGLYRFPSLPPGSYSARVEVQGFQPVLQSQLRVSVGNTLTVDFNLEMPPVSETMQISGKSSLIDVTSAATPHTVPTEALENLPKPSFAMDLITMTPGIGDLDFVAYGAGGESANAYWMDGVDITDPFFGIIWVSTNYNWFQEIQVTGIGAPAEYGGFTGVVANSITRSGGNEFHGLLETFFQNDSFVSNNLDDKTQEPSTIKKLSDTTVQMGGLIIRDKLWFFSGLQFYYRQDHPFGYNGRMTEKDPRVITKLTYKLDANNTLQGFGEWDRYYVDGRDAGATTLPEATWIQRDPESTWNATWTSILNSKTVLDARFGGFWGIDDHVSRNGETPAHLDLATQIHSANAVGTRTADRLRNQLNISVSRYADNFLGKHDFKFGVEFERSKGHDIYSYNGGFFYYDFFGEPYLRFLWQGQDADVRNHRTSTFVQDDWSANERLTLNLGVRWDHNRGILARESGSIFRTDPIAPRLGFVYSLDERHRTVIKGHYGHYYEALLSSYFWLLDNFADQFTEIFDPSSGEWDEINTIRHVYTMDPQIRHPVVQQFTIGLDHVFPDGWDFGAHYIYRKWKNIIDDVNATALYDEIPFPNPVTGQSITVFNRLNTGQDQFIVTNPAGLFRRYDALELFLNRRLSKTFSLSSSLVISRAKGNIGNDTFDFEAGNNIGTSRLFDDKNFNINISGRLPNDPTYEIKIVGIYDLPWGINSSWYFRHASGDTWTPTMRVTDLNQGPLTIYALPRGANRLPSRTVLDLRLEKEIPFYFGQLRFTVDVFNVFNTGYPTSVGSLFGSEVFEEPLSFTNPREIRAGVRYTF